MTVVLRCLGVLVGLFVAAVVGLLLTTGAYGPIPGVTHSATITADLHCVPYAVSPDSTTLVYGVHVRGYRRAIFLMAFPDGGPPEYEESVFELYRYDLVARGSPRLVAAWEVPAAAVLDLPAFDGDQATIGMGIELHRDHGESFETIRLDDGSRLQHPPSATDSILAAARRAQRERPPRDDPHRVQIDLTNWSFVSQDPRTREEVTLVDLPTEHRGRTFRHVGELARERSERDAALAIHRPWDLTARAERDSLRLSIRTYVERPGLRARDYAFRYALTVPDTSRNRDTIWTSLKDILAVEGRTLGPSGTTLIKAFAWEELDSVLAPYRRGTRGEKRWPWPTSIHVRIVPVIEPSDPVMNYKGIWRGEDMFTHIEVP